MEKRCKVCGVLKALDEFYRAAGMKDGHRNDCKTCNLAAKAVRHRAKPEPARARARQWQRDNPERHAARMREYRASGRKAAVDRRSHLKRRFGITVEEYDALLDTQGGTCALCRRPPRDDISLHVDHDHLTGRVRALLCFDCNAGLGKFQDDLLLLRRATEYVMHHKLIALLTQES